MSEAAARATIYGIVAGVSKTGQVYDYERWANEWPKFLDLFKTVIVGQPQIRGWTVTCVSMPQRVMEFTGTLLRSYTFKVRGYLGLDDSAESEKTAIALAEDVVEALDASTTLHDGGTYYNAEPASLDVFELRIFGGHLAHYAEITQVVEEVMT